jgi:hypothetical protein
MKNLRFTVILAGLAILPTLLVQFIPPRGFPMEDFSSPAPMQESISLTWDDAIRVEETSFPVLWPHE